MNIFRALTVIVTVLSIASCASFGPNDEKPVVMLKSFTPTPSSAGGQGFEITLGVINPSREVLELYGVVYTISIQGHELVKGVGKDFEPVEAYSEGTLKLTAQPNLLAGIRMFSQMMNQPTEVLEYEFEAKLDTGGWSVPIRIREVGEFNVRGTATGPN